MQSHINVPSRRDFILNGTLFLAAGSSLAAQGVPKPIARIGLLTDVHYADTPERGTRFYRESLDKLGEAVDKLNAEKVDLTVELGDLIDALPKPDAQSEERFLRRVNHDFSRLRAPRHYVMGNHCLDSLTKRRFLDIIERPRSYYSFDAKGLHFVVLDACFRKDGVDYGERNAEWTDTEIPLPQQEWLAADLAATKLKTLAFVHQRIDLGPGESHTIHSAAKVRSILESRGNVLAVFQGHHHVNDFRRVGGIGYCTLQAMVEGSGALNTAYSILDVMSDGSMRLNGFKKHSENGMVKAKSG